MFYDGFDYATVHFYIYSNIIFSFWLQYQSSVMNLMLDEQIIKSEDSYHYIKYQQNQFHQKNNPSFQNQIRSFAIEKAIITEILQKTQPISVLTNNSANYSYQLLEIQNLLQYLTYIQSQMFNIEAQIFKDALKESKGLFLNYMTQFWQSLGEQEKSEYEQVGMKNYMLMKLYEGDEKVEKDKFSGFQMLKVDVLGMVFLFNNYYVIGYKNNERRLLRYDFLQSIFDMSRVSITKMANAFEKQQRNIRIDYWKHFEFYIELLCLIKLAYKQAVYYKAKGRTAFQRIPSVFVQLNKQITCSIPSSMQEKYRFCMIAYEPIVKARRQQLVSKRSIIHKTKARFEREDMLIKIEQQYNIPFDILAQKTQMDPNSIISKDQYFKRFEKNLYKCQWVFLKGPQSLTDGISIAFGSKFTSSQCWGIRRLGLISTLLKLAMERFNLLPNIFKIQEKLQLKTSLYAHRFQFSLREIEGIQKNEGEYLEQQGQNFKVSLVMIATNSQMVACSFCRQAMTQDLYISLVKLCSKQIIAKYTNGFNLVIYQFDYKKSMSFDTLILFQVYMNKRYSARIYILNDPKFFELHFILNAFLKSFLVKLKFDKTSFQMLVQLSINKLLKGIENFSKRTIEEYFAYFSKIMSLQIVQKDVLVCFEKERCNKYNAVLLVMQDLKEQWLPKSKSAVQSNTQVPPQQWLKILELCSPSFEVFTKLQEKERWRCLEPYKEQQTKSLKSYLKRKHMKERDIKRILRDTAKFLIEWQLYFRQIKDQRLIQNAQIDGSKAFLTSFYQQENKNIELVYSCAERQGIIQEAAKKYQKGISVSELRRKNQSRQSENTE